MEVSKTTYLSLRRRGSTVAAKRTTEARYVMEVVRIAQMVPTGIEACGSAKSPDRLEPAIIPANHNST